MRLSEAIMLGSTQTEFHSDSWDHCLIGMGFHAVAGLSARIGFQADEAVIRWPWLANFITCPSEVSRLVGIDAWNALDIISHVAGEVEKGNVTLEAAVDWIRSVEPQEEPVRIPDAREEEVCLTR